MIELLSPVGDFDSLKAAIQNGADAVYFAAKSFGARAFATNFDDETLLEAINYAKLRKVKTHLTLNTLIKEEELENAFNLAKKAYEFGIDAIIIQDLGLASILSKKIPDLELHASTQMTVHNLEGVNLLKKLGFKRVVLSRELSYEEIKYICENTDIEIEVFVHGALCICYSGQCLFSSMIGGRSGNRGKCAQTCRLPYSLIEKTYKNNAVLNSEGIATITKKEQLTTIDNGYLLSTRDLCLLEYLPKLIKAGVTSFKIEGRMKSPEYVATVTRIYKKYIELAQKNPENYKIKEEDKLQLMQVFNRGYFSDGHFSNKENTNLVFNEKQNNMGIYLGTVKKYNKNKGHITCKLNSPLSIGDSICFENETSKYTISELMQKNTNIQEAIVNQEVTFGRMKGKININDKIYKISDKKLSNYAIASFSKENIKVSLECNIDIKQNEKIFVKIFSPEFNLKITYAYDFVPQVAQNSPISKEKIIEQFNKTLNTEFYFSKFEINLDDNLFIPISTLNDVRRYGISLIKTKILDSFKRESNVTFHNDDNKVFTKKTPKISLLLNKLNLDYNYTNFNNISKLYIPLKYFYDNTYFKQISILSDKYNLYIYMPTIIRKPYIEKAKKSINFALENINIKGFVISHLSQLDIIENHSKYEIIGNYTLNTFNTLSINKNTNLNISISTISPELDESGLNNIFKNNTNPTELIVYGNIPVMTMNYCVLGKSNKCYNKCDKKCLNYKSDFYLKDRMNILFKIVADNNHTITTIYNSKTTSINYNDFNPDFIRIDILDENIDEINTIINTVYLGNRFEGKNYTNGNLRRTI